MDHMRISVLHLGRLEFLKKYLIVCDSENEVIRCQIPALLIQHPVLGNILYDTGNSPLYSSDYSRVIQDNYPVVQFISVEEALAEKGVKLTDINMLVISHLHFDHAGGLKYFAGTKAVRNVIVSEGDLKHAYFMAMTGNEGAYCRSLMDVRDLQFKTVSEETKLADDLILFPQKCHTPGVIGLIIKLKNAGNIIVTSDTVYTRENYEKRLPPGGHNSHSQADFFINLERIRCMEEEYQAQLFFGHDEEQVIQWSKRGWID